MKSESRADCGLNPQDTILTTPCTEYSGPVNLLYKQLIQHGYIIGSIAYNEVLLILYPDFVVLVSKPPLTLVWTDKKANQAASTREVAPGNEVMSCDHIDFGLLWYGWRLI